MRDLWRCLAAAAALAACSGRNAGGGRPEADALGKLGAKEARAALEKAQHDPDADVAGVAGRALKELP
jgi:hypothetical protein